MGKARTDRNGNTREQRLSYENQQLKKQVSKLRKQLARIDLDRYEMVKDMIQEHYQDDRAAQGQEILDDLKKHWKCKVCNEGYLEIILYSKTGSTWYFRRCNSCDHRTKSQEYSENVKGIVNNA